MQTPLMLMSSRYVLSSVHNCFCSVNFYKRSWAFKLQLLTDFTWSVFEVIPESRCFIGTNLLLEQVKMVIKCSFYLGGCWVLNYAAADEENHIYVTNMRTHTKCKKACFSSF